jgi:hypothetical protein
MVVKYERRELCGNMMVGVVLDGASLLMLMCIKVTYIDIPWAANFLL